jgi:two-component sensor histidine kinase
MQICVCLKSLSYNHTNIIVLVSIFMRLQILSHTFKEKMNKLKNSVQRPRSLSMRHKKLYKRIKFNTFNDFTLMKLDNVKENKVTNNQITNKNNMDLSRQTARQSDLNIKLNPLVLSRT